MKWKHFRILIKTRVYIQIEQILQDIIIENETRYAILMFSFVINRYEQMGHGSYV